jgi:hypothetical protein
VFTAQTARRCIRTTSANRFRLLVDRSGLLPIRPHGPRHGAGADLKTVQDQLGHASIGITADLYTNVLPATRHRALAATARPRRHATRPTAQEEGTQAAPVDVGVQVPVQSQVRPDVRSDHRRS